jgi:rfaE bifunctional protein kinase chain/domain
MTAWSAATEDALIAAIERAAKEVDAFLFSDYGYRTLSSRVRARALDATRGKVRVADSRYALAEFAGVTLVTPNQEEAEACLGYAFDGDEAVRRAGAELVSRLGLEAAFITRGNLGLALFDRKGSFETIPVSGPSEIVDVTGAGDTVAAVATLCLVAGSTFGEAARLANAAASVVVMKLRAATLDTAELAAAAGRLEDG